MRRDKLGVALMGRGDPPFPRRASNGPHTEGPISDLLHPGHDDHFGQADQDGYSIDHERARQLIEEQTHRQLPPAEANALADHLLTCDRCFRYAQDVAARERHRASEHP